MARTTLAAVDYESSINNSLDRIAVFVPKLALFLVILVVGVIVAKVAEKVVSKLLQKVGFDKMVERGGVKQAMSGSKYDAAGIMGRIAYYFLFLGVLSLAFGVFGGNNPIAVFINRVTGFLPNLFVALLAVVIGFAIAAAVKDVVRNAIGGLSYGPMVANVAGGVIVAMGVFFALDQLQIAPLIVGGVFYAVLALAVIPPIIAFGIGGIEPARELLLNMQEKAREKSQEIRQQASAEEKPSEPKPSRVSGTATRSTASSRSVPRTTTSRRRT
jgi:hypothetical protein